MQVFHYLSHVLRNMRNFECAAGRVNSEDGEGVVYNDFDFDTTSLVVEAANLCSHKRHTNYIYGSARCSRICYFGSR